MFSFPDILGMAMSIQVLFLGTILIVFISNKVTEFLEMFIPFFPLLLIIHLNLICFSYHYLKSLLLWTEIQGTTYKFDKNVYLDTSILVGPVISMTSIYIRRFIFEYLSLK
jgi:hypothetical protein